jgi:chromosome segregation ATPase
MGFSDLLTSSRGPGVIGTLLALLVLVGFGTLYMFVFDEGLQGGGKTIEAVIRDDGLQIESNRRQIEAFKRQIEEGTRLREQAREIEQVKVRLESGAKTLAETTAERDAATTALADAEKAWEDYKDAYRASEWASAEGEELGDLKALSGKVYTKVVIRSVDHTGIQITDLTGPKSIDSADLPLDLQDRFQFSETRKAEVVTKRNDDFQTLSDNVDIANLAKKGQDKLERVRVLNVAIEEANEGIQTCKAAEPVLLRRVDGIRAELAEEAAKAARRAGSRAQGINKTPQMREALRVAENKVSANRKKISENEKAIRDSKREITQLEREVEQVKAEISKLKKEMDAKQSAQQDKP